ncbi:unnamed protein product, partial [Citrullus colocynthis]
MCVLIIDFTSKFINWYQSSVSEGFFSKFRVVFLISPLQFFYISPLIKSSMSAKFELDRFDEKGDFFFWKKKMKALLVQQKVSKALDDP